MPRAMLPKNSEEQMGAIAALDLVVFVVVVAFVYASITQVLIPIFQDKPLFPFFRQRRLERELREVEERDRGCPETGKGRQPSTAGQGCGPFHKE